MKSLRALPFISLFTSISTLLCCALPALLVALGAGAVLAQVVTTVPALIWVSENKPLVFGGAALMLILAGFALYYARNLPCPIDPTKAQACKKARRFSIMTYSLSLLTYAVGSIFAFGLS